MTIPVASLPAEGVPVASVVICTYNRLRMLEHAVASCLRDATARGTPFELVIADNSPSAHAKALAEDLAASGNLVRWVHATPPNISVARNAGLRTAVAPLVAFMDDDLELERGWLDHLLDTLERTGADVVLGPVRPRFAGTPPAWDPDLARFTRVIDAPSGTPIEAGGARKGGGFVVSTASSLWRRDTCFTDAEPFDPAFGVSGGEDLDLFLRLQARGRRFVWCAEASVWETIPASRTALRFQALREFTGAQVYTATSVRHSNAPWVRTADIMARGAVQVAIGTGAVVVAGLLAPITGPAGRRRLVRHIFKTAAGAGKLFWFRKAPLYHTEKPQP